MPGSHFLHRAAHYVNVAHKQDGVVGGAGSTLKSACLLTVTNEQPPPGMCPGLTRRAVWSRGEQTKVSTLQELATYYVITRLGPRELLDYNYCSSLLPGLCCVFSLM